MADNDLLTAGVAKVRLGASGAAFWNLAKRHKAPRHTIPLRDIREHLQTGGLAKPWEPWRVEEKAS